MLFTPTSDAEDLVRVKARFKLELKLNEKPKEYKSYTACMKVAK